MGGHLAQPVLGVAGIVICTVSALALSVSFSLSFFNTWVGFIAVSAIPLQITMGLVWNNEVARTINSWHQPARGIALLCILVAGTTVICPLLFISIGGSIIPPTPTLIHFCIFSVIMSMWVVVVFDTWPATVLFRDRFRRGLLALVFTYAVTYLFFHLLFDYSAIGKQHSLEGSSSYPQGWLDAWSAITFSLVTVMVINAFSLLEFWPINLICDQNTAFKKQPVAGLVRAGFVIPIALLIFWIGTIAFEIPVIHFMVRFVVAFIFGEFIMLVLLETSPVEKVKQPIKGIFLIFCCALLALIMYWLYSSVALWFLNSSANTSALVDVDLWIATAMLGITFPLMVMYSGFFAFWPLSGR